MVWFKAVPVYELGVKVSLLDMKRASIAAHQCNNIPENRSSNFQQFLAITSSFDYEPFPVPALG